MTFGTDKGWRNATRVTRRYYMELDLVCFYWAFKGLNTLKKMLKEVFCQDVGTVCDRSQIMTVCFVLLLLF